MNAQKVMAWTPYIEVAVRNAYWGSPVLPAISGRLDAWRGKRTKKAGVKPPSTSIDKIIDAMRAWGVSPGDLLVVHSAFRGIRAGGKKPDDIVDALLELVGPGGTLVAPAIPYWKEAPADYARMVADVSDLVLDYDPATTPMWTGAVPAAMAKRAGALRSHHPLNTVVAIGPLAEAMMEGNLDGERPFACGPQSAWRFIYRHNAKVVAMGADLAHSLTMIHLAEDMQGDDWPVEGWYRDRKFRIKVGDEWRLYTIPERHPRWACFYGERTLSKDLRATGVCEQVEFDGVNVEMISGVEMIDYLDRRNHTLYPYFGIPPWKRKASAGPISRNGLRHRRSLPGRKVIYTGKDAALLADSRRLYRYDFDGDEVREVCPLPGRESAGLGRVFGATRMLRRAARYGARTAIALDDHRYLIVVRGAIYEVDARSGTCRVSQRLDADRRPLFLTRLQGITGFDDMVVYGEYGMNPQRGPMRVFGLVDGETEWRQLYTFGDGEVLHVHRVVADPYRDCVWILTGDFGDEAGFWIARDNFRQVEAACRGEQNYRACDCFPRPDGLLYATDSQLDQNSLRMLRPDGKGGWASETLRSMVGSGLYAAQLGERYFFSTAVEPPPYTGHFVRDWVDPRAAPGTDTNACELVMGTPEGGFEVALSWPVDGWPKRLFGHSVIVVPPTDPGARRLLVTGAGVRGHDEVTEVFEVS